jgi:outer membrane protein OmpA-like peptidoglycan-associated protein
MTTRKATWKRRALSAFVAACAAFGTGDTVSANYKVADSLIVIQECCWFKAKQSAVPTTCDLLLEAVVTVMREHPDIELISIEGHSASVGDGKSEMDRWNLSMNRARNVRDALVSRGVDSSRFTMVAFGDDHPMAAVQSRFGYDKNRRVELRVLKVVNR